MQVAIAKRALHDSPHCGDQGGYWQSGGKITLCIADGLGHGIEAEKAARAAMDFVARHFRESLPDVFAGCNAAIRSTRGVAMGIAVIDEDMQTLTYAGIGNTRAMIVGADIVRFVSNHGIVGGGYKTLLPRTASLMPSDLVVLSTDGLPEIIDMSGYGTDLRRDVHLLAEKIIRDWRRDTDDAAVLVSRYEAS